MIQEHSWGVGCPSKTLNILWKMFIADITEYSTVVYSIWINTSILILVIICLINGINICQVKEQTDMNYGEFWKVNRMT